ncbi:type II toxin-antitoxin system RelE/ParE family toxin [Curtobacterium sp. NPDC090217]|uniref:type II toxin-antitoxin system RelE family toxin n=1 Tax=unclassified Curtobacterium TaxID=257496 RepID=UPI0007D72478|nr:type II toxin-antitoxin system RelE/ParE family toxin [Curtobacterium sp. 9128]SBN61454.1 mRNA interferase RelE/StbE [Curtobacterium sp. 9128]
MTYEVDVEPHARRAIRKLPPHARRLVEGVLVLLAEEPRPPAARKLVGSAEWRVRVAEYRVIYRIDDGRLVVVVVAAAHRREVYRDR